MQYAIALSQDFLDAKVIQIKMRLHKKFDLFVSPYCFGNSVCLAGRNLRLQMATQRRQEISTSSLNNKTRQDKLVIENVNNLVFKKVCTIKKHDKQKIKNKHLTF